MAGDMRIRHRKIVSSSQIELLGLLFKYRFGSVELLRSSLGLNTNPGVYRQLAILVDKGYVGKRYDSSYRIAGKPANYYLLPTGLKELQKLEKHEAINDNLIKYAYNDKTRISDQFVAHTLNIYQAALQLMRLHPGLKFFTKRETAGLSYIPKPPPDGFVSLKLKNETEPRRFFLDVIPDSMYRRELDKKLADYIDFFDEDNWQKVAGSTLPKLLLLCESGSTEKRTQRQVVRKLYDEGLECLTSTMPSLMNASAQEKAIWSDVEDPEEIHDLIATQTGKY